MIKRILLLVILSAIGSCSAKEPTVRKEGTFVADPESGIAAIGQIRQNYPAYSSLSAQFVLKGKVDKNEILYDGTLTIKGDSLAVVLKDPVFRSPFFSLKVEKDLVTQTDHLRNKTDRVPFADYRWVELFGRVFPFRFFHPLLKGYPPDEIYRKGARYETLEGDKGRFQFETEYFDAIVNIERGILASLYYRGRVDQEIVVMTFTGNANAKKGDASQRHFPAQIYITRPRSDDYVRLEFKKIQIDMP